MEKLFIAEMADGFYYFAYNRECKTITDFIYWIEEKNMYKETDIKELKVIEHGKFEQLYS